ncbi:MAG: hypothetical protein ACRCTI_12420 [Beijerinckiaceae bacterium]
MNDTGRRIKLSIGILAALIIGGVYAMHLAGAEPMLIRMVAIAGGLLVTLLIVTYRALRKIVEMAKANPTPPVPDDDDEDDR